MLLHFHSLGFVQSSSVSFSLPPLKLVQYGNLVAEGTNGADYQTDELFLSPRRAQISVSNHSRSCHSHVRLLTQPERTFEKPHRHSLLGLYFVPHYLVAPVFWLPSVTL